MPLLTWSWLAACVLAACVQDGIPHEPPLAVIAPIAAAPGVTSASPASPPPSSTSGVVMMPAATAPSMPLAGAPAMPAASAQPAPGGAGAAAAGAPATAAPTGPSDPQCDLRGGWLAQLVTSNSALGATQLATAWAYHRFEQDGDRVRVVQSLDCGLTVRGTADVSLSDATLEALATRSPHATGVQGRFARSPDGASCTLTLDRAYAIRGANRDRFLTATWKVGDPPKPLSEFTLPKNAQEGMEDWDNDGHEGFTLLTGLGDRYIAQIDYFALSGQVPSGTRQFGGRGVLAVDHDAREAISIETPVLLQATGTPVPPGYAFMANVDGEFTLPQGGERPMLEACRRIQALSIQKFGDPPRP